jgi:predicted TIM-barrel fold metal-dependent hydrolase
MVAIKQHMDAFADDPRQDAISEAAADLDVPIVWHAWYKKADGYPHESDASHIARLARRTPRTRYVMAHLTGVARRGVQDVADLPNVWVDTSGCWPESEIVEYAVRHLGAERVVYGSDYVGRDYAVQLARVLGARIPDEDKEKVLWRNAAALLKLDR